MKITDKMRLDWLTSREFDMHCLYGEVWIGNGRSEIIKSFRTPRKAIDAAILAEKKTKNGNNRRLVK